MKIFKIFLLIQIYLQISNENIEIFHEETFYLELFKKHSDFQLYQNLQILNVKPEIKIGLNSEIVKTEIDNEFKDIIVENDNIVDFTTNNFIYYKASDKNVVSFTKIQERKFSDNETIIKKILRNNEIIVLTKLPGNIYVNSFKYMIYYFSDLNKLENFKSFNFQTEFDIQDFKLISLNPSNSESKKLIFHNKSNAYIVNFKIDTKDDLKLKPIDLSIETDFNIENIFNHCTITEQFTVVFYNEKETKHVIKNFKLSADNTKFESDSSMLENLSLDMINKIQFYNFEVFIDFTRENKRKVFYCKSIYKIECREINDNFDYKSLNLSNGSLSGILKSDNNFQLYQYDYLINSLVTKTVDDKVKDILLDMKTFMLFLNGKLLQIFYKDKNKRSANKPYY